ncbi:carboxylate/amino acid/amine transporter [Vogesella indigofera]|uniref:carboxylate/amino acid/amine transporter n=1 Tax=Vogesella indigofera TaxID=45465 RepID=UPI00234DA9AB|nr:carboxylate/amino acid/amine transporter [Vogesella indigofera]MDC7702831.1 carboxylate/amino acid/amine transporter [Vogesella indigofera]
MTTASRLWRDTLLTAVVPLIWGSTYLVTTQWLPPGLPLTAGVLRVLPAGLLLLLWTRHLPQRGEWPRLLLLSLLNIGAFQALLFVAAYRLPGGIAAVLGAIQPLLMMGLLWGLERQTPRPLVLLAACAGLAGMAVLLNAGQAQWDSIGVLAAGGGAVVMALGMYLARRWGSSLPLLALTGWQLALGGLMLLPAALWLDPPLPSLSAANVAGYAYLSLVGALLAYGLWFRGLRLLPPVAVSALGLLSPVAAVILGWVALGQRLHGWTLIGMVTVLASVLCVQLASSRRPARA